MGRKTTYTEEAAEQIVDRLASGEPLAAICRDEDMPAYRTVYDWAEANPDFAARIAHARVDGFDMIAADCLTIADDAAHDTKAREDGSEACNSEWISRSKLRVETRLKLLAKWDPKRYGERQHIEHSGEVPEELKAWLTGRPGS